MNEKKILYVEDDLSLIEGLKYALEKNGFLVDNARTVMEAYQFFRAGQYDLLLLDVTLPDGTGFDIGTGIHQKDIHNIFKRFYRSHISQDTHGIGLGLPLAKSIVEAHQGTISVTSRVGQGSRFVLSFFQNILFLIKSKLVKN